MKSNIYGFHGPWQRHRPIRTCSQTTICVRKQCAWKVYLNLCVREVQYNLLIVQISCYWTREDAIPGRRLVQPNKALTTTHKHAYQTIKIFLEGADICHKTNGDKKWPSDFINCLRSGSDRCPRKLIWHLGHLRTWYQKYATFVFFKRPTARNRQNGT